MGLITCITGGLQPGRREGEMSDQSYYHYIDEEYVKTVDWRHNVDKLREENAALKSRLARLREAVERHRSNKLYATFESELLPSDRDLYEMLKEVDSELK